MIYIFHVASFIAALAALFLRQAIPVAIGAIFATATFIKTISLAKTLIWITVISLPIILSKLLPRPYNYLRYISPLIFGIVSRNIFLTLILSAMCFLLQFELSDFSLKRIFSFLILTGLLIIPLVFEKAWGLSLAAFLLILLNDDPRSIIIASVALLRIFVYTARIETGVDLSQSYILSGALIGAIYNYIVQTEQQKFIKITAIFGIPLLTAITLHSKGYAGFISGTILAATATMKPASFLLLAASLGPVLQKPLFSYTIGITRTEHLRLMAISFVMAAVIILILWLVQRYMSQKKQTPKSRL